MRVVKRGAGRARMWTGGTSPGPPGDPSRRWRAAQNGKSESPPGGSAGAKRHAPAAPAAVVRLRQSRSTSADGRPLFLGKASAECKELLCGGYLLLSGVRGAGRGACDLALGGGVVEDGPRHGRDGDGDVLLQSAVASRVIRRSVLPATP